MTGTIDIVAISALGCFCIYLLWPKKSKELERIPLLKDREIKLEEGENFLREEKAKHFKLQDELNKKLKEVEKREKKLKRDIQTFDDNLLVQAKELQNREDEVASKEKQLEYRELKIESKEKELKSKEKTLEAREIEIQSKIENVKSLESREKEVKSRAETVEAKEKEIKSKESKLKEDLGLLEENRAKQEALDETLEKRSKTLKAREAELEKAESKLAAKDKGDVEATITKNDEQEPVVVNDEEPTSTAKEETEEPKQFDAEMRKKLIEEELERIVKQTNETELGEDDPIDEDSLEALKKGAMKVCYLKKYYDVMKDEFIYFPSVAKTCLDYSLIEEAEKFYFEEEDEYPSDISAGLRSVAVAIISETEDDDMDEDYMNMLAQDVEI